MKAEAAAALARSYERATPASLRARRGLFYTPDDVADVVARAAIAVYRSSRPGASLDRVTVLDRSCGAGALLAAARRALGPAARLVGTDIDASALDLARDRLGPRAQLSVGDALEAGPRADLVLTNPPYGRDASSPDRDRFITFWRAALARLEPGGVLAVLAPTTWRTGVRYAGARREVIDPAGVRQVVPLPRASFPDAYVDTCVAVCQPGRGASAAPDAPPETPGTTLGSLFASRRGILAPPASASGVRLLLGPVAPFAWPRHRAAFTRVDPRDVVEGKAALSLDRGPRLLVRRIVGRSSRLTPIVALRRSLVKKDFYILSPRDPRLSLEAYAALLHARPVASRLAADEVASTKEDFAQVTLARLRQLAVPRLHVPSARARSRLRGTRDEDVDARDLVDAAAWLELWARRGARVGALLAAEGGRFVDADPRWRVLRARLDAFVGRMNKSGVVRW